MCYEIYVIHLKITQWHVHSAMFESVDSVKFKPS